VHYTREPIIETIITPREGYKLVIRSSRSGEQEEYLVDALEVVSFNTALFFRSVERPKCFLLPVTDYEVLEVRETRMVLKHAAGEERGGGRARSASSSEEEGKPEKKRRRRSRRRSSGSDETPAEVKPAVAEEEKEEKQTKEVKEPALDLPPPTLIPPPETLISETIERYQAAMSIEGEPAASDDSAEEDLDWEELRLPAPDPLAEGSDEPAKGAIASSRLLQRLTGKESFSALPPAEGGEEESSE